MENINKGLLHRAFSAFVFRPEDGKLLLQQRATEKITFPDMWTNTCCSHPLDDFEEEKVEKDQLGVRVAATRKLEHELGIPKEQTPVDRFQYLTRIHYLAPSDGLWGEHEGTRVAQTLLVRCLNAVQSITSSSSPPTSLSSLISTRSAITSTSTRRSCRRCSMTRVRYSCAVLPFSELDVRKANSFTPWFKLIARDFLFGWWDELLARRGSNGLLDAKSLNGIVDGSKVVSMV